MIAGVLIGLTLVASDVPRYGKKLAANNNIPGGSVEKSSTSSNH